jgi:hypothetical protein
MNTNGRYHSGECSNDSLDSRAHPPSVITDQESRLPPPTYLSLPVRHQPLLPHPVSINQPMLSVLWHPTTTPSRSISKTPEPVLSTRSMLTMEDLHRRLYKKPSLFQLESKTRKRSTSRTRKKPVSATKALAKSLTSALAALSCFLTEMQPKSDTCCPSHLQIHFSRAMRAA